MRAVVTGAAGFIGSTLSRRLRREGWEVVGVDSFTSTYEVERKRRNVAGFVDAGIELIESDLTEMDLSPVLHDVDVVFHQAGQPGVRSSWGNGFPAYVVRNVVATQRLLDSLRDHPTLKRFVFASSSSIYGDAESYPTSEGTRPRPVSPYGVTKLAAEHLTTLYGENLGVPTTSLRYFTVYGPAQRPDMAFARFVNAALDGSTIDIYGDGEQVRDFTFVDDVVEANLLAATTATPAGSVYNVAGGTNTSVNEVLGMLTELTGSQLAVRYTPRAMGDVLRTGGDTSLISDELGWSPNVDLREGLSRQLARARDSVISTS